MKSLLRWIGWMVVAVLTAFVVLLGIAVVAVQPRPGDWSVSVRGVAIGVPTLLRWATHPVALPLLDGRSLATAQGRWQLRLRADGALEARCTPCALAQPALGSQPVVVPAATLVLHRRGADRFDGTLAIAGSDGATALQLGWRGELRADGLRLQAELPPTPLARALAPFAEAVPEAGRARIAGSVALKIEAQVGAQGLHIVRAVPVLAEVQVDGLGTEALADADLAARCRPQPASGRVEGWLPHAVVAAEDQRFFEHAGYEIEPWLAAWAQNQGQPDALAGASTLTMQLAKLLYTGDERSATRKLREWLYAIEMERTLGKGRILQLYLGVAPWGDGVCGAEAAARHHLGKPTAQLRPREAAFLAALLVNPDAQIRRWAADDSAARERAAFVLRGMRRLPRERREAELDALADWRPPIGRMPVRTGASP